MAADEVRVVRKGFRRVRAWSVAGGVIAALVGFMIVAFLRGPDPFRQQLEASTEGDLARILASLSTESQSLEEQLTALKLELAQMQNSADAQDVRSSELTSQLNAAKVLAGTTEVSGPGIEVIIDDPKHVATYDLLLSLVTELRDAGAEAIAMNDIRIGVASSFTSEGGSIRLDSTPINAPYTVKAIGPGAAMEGGLKIPGGSIDSLKAEDGIHVDVHGAESLRLPAVRTTPTFRSAQPSP